MVGNKSYVNLTYQNSKEQQAGYQALESLLDSTSPESQQAFNILEGYTQTFISFGYDEQEARNLAGCYVSAIYLFGGILAIKASQTLVKRFGTDIAGKGTTGNNISHLTAKQQQIIKNAESISTAKSGTQVTKPRDLNEQIFWKQVQNEPTSGRILEGMNNDARFPESSGFQKMEAVHKLPDGSSITIHYQYNTNTGKAYDMKITTPKPKWPQPGTSLTGDNK